MRTKAASAGRAHSFFKSYISRCLIVLIVATTALMFVSANQGWRSSLPEESNSPDKMSSSPHKVQRVTESIAHLGVPSNPASSPTPEAGNRSESPYPDNLPQQGAETFAPENTTASQVYINFDNVSSGTLISNQYPPARFSTDWTHYTFAHSQFYYGSSAANHLDRGPLSSTASGYAPLYVDFTTPINDLRFYLLAVDELRAGIAQLKIFQSGVLTATRNIDGRGIFYMPLLIDIGGPVSSGGMGYSNVTRIEVLNITDVKGVAFDDFSFTVPAPTPTPTPTPTPSPTPLPPTNLGGEGHIEEITLVWELQANTTGYNIKRRASFEPSWTTIATGVQPTTSTSFGNTHLIGRYRDHSANPDVVYSYAVTAVNASGESANSNVFSASLAPSCGDHVEPRPAQRHYPDPGNGWSLTTNVSDRDGLVVSDASLNGRYMAKQISVPYFTVKTSKMSGTQRGELTPSSDVPLMRTRLRRYATPLGLHLDGRTRDFYFVAEYAVDRLTPTSKSCLLITQEYVFLEQRAGDKCEPSGTLPCSRFYPKVSYKFTGRGGETLERINIPERLHYRVGGSSENTIALFRDWDVPVPGAMFKDYVNPVVLERQERVVQNGRDYGSWDNIHQTNKPEVSHPPHDVSEGMYGGCPECVHTHWRWGSYFRYFPFFFSYATGLPIVGSNPSIFHQTNQDVDIAILRYKLGEEHPALNFSSLIEIDPSERVRNSIGSRQSRLRRIPVLGPADVVYWYSGTSYEPVEDLFFKHGSFFNPNLHQHVTALKAPDNSSTSASQDGVRSITYSHVYKDGPTIFATVSPSAVAPLPAGYVTLDNAVHRIATEAIASGPHTVSFDVPSVASQTVFDDLAIFHLEQDPFDPDNLIWVDVTVLAPETPAPDFTNRVVSARVDDVGYFAIGKLIQPQPAPGDSDLLVTVTDSPDPVVVENNLTYVLRVTNNGPQASLGVGIVDVLPLETVFISASPTQGNCKFRNGSVYCKLGTLANGSSADVTIAVGTREDRVGIPPSGKSIANSVVTASDNNDPILDNNSAVINTLTLANPNSRPIVNITSPSTGATFTGPVNLSVTATASDSDGTIARVDFYDEQTLVGAATPTGTPNQYALALSVGFGSHSLVAVATDNGGRTNSSDRVNIFVNGTASINIVSPAAGAILNPESSLGVTANATNASISKVEFFANSIAVGEGSLTAPNEYSVTWANIPSGTYALVAALTDSSGVITNSAPVSVTVSSRPSVEILSPTQGTSFPVASKVTVMASVEDTDGFVRNVDFFANGEFIGSGSSIGRERFAFDWIQAPDGIYSLTAIATDDLGVSTTSAPITIGVNNPSPRLGEFVWFDDSLPTGATPAGDGENWHWTDANPSSFSGQVAHQSRNFAHVDATHQHFFLNATQRLAVSAGDKLFTYVFLDINNMPREIMLQWHDGSTWEHRAYWGENRIEFGTNGTNSRRYMGPLPAAGQWVRLEVPANLVGLEGANVNGMAFTLQAGRATWDMAGKVSANAEPPPTTAPGDFVWVEDSLPAGAIPAAEHDHWEWVSSAPAPFSGQTCHRSFLANGTGTPRLRSHSFTGAQTQMQVNPGDVLFTYVYLDPTHTPDEIMVQWHDGTSWEHRAFWGRNFADVGVTGTESRRYSGGLPPAGVWTRLEIPASYVGLEGKTVSGMAFGYYKQNDRARVSWDKSGKNASSSSTALPLSALTPLWRIRGTGGSGYYRFTTKDVAGWDETFTHVGYVDPKQAAGTVPFHAFRESNDFNARFFYSTNRDGAPQGWLYVGIAFYVYPDASSPGTVPLHLFTDGIGHFFTTNPNEGAGKTSHGIVAYIKTVNPLVPAPPSHLHYDGIWMRWKDNSGTETEFKIERYDYPGTNSWIQIATVPANTTFFKVGTLYMSSFRVRATNGFGNSAYSNSACGCQEDWVDSPNTLPEIYIASPVNSEVVVQDFNVSVNVFDSNGAGTIVKVELYGDGIKLGESNVAPYLFVWNNAPSGLHTLTAVATDAAGMTKTSPPVNVIVSGPPIVSLTEPANGSVFTSPANISLQANASDADGSISKVEFFQGDTKIGEDTAAPYTLSWTNVSAGNYQLWARAFDNNGLATSSPLVSITVNSLPTVTITNPSNGFVVNAPANLTITASAYDTDGSINKVEFYQGSTLIGTDMTHPFAIAWNGVGYGTYTLTAKATDNRDAITTSAPITVTVNTAPGSSQIIFASNREGSSQLYSMNLDGTNLLRRTNHLANDESPRWSTNNSRIVFQSDRVNPFSGASDIYVMNPDGSGQTRLTTDAADDSASVWSPDGTKIAFQSLRNGSHYQVYVMNADGSGQVNISNSTSNDGHPSWSPDGTKIAFASDRDHPGKSSIYVMNANGSNQTRVTFNGSDISEEQPTWSPDGTRIAFVSTRDSVVETWQETDDNGAVLTRTRLNINKEVYVMNTDGTDQIRLTNTLENDDSPVWSRDGTKLLFRSDRERECCDPMAQIWVMNADGSNQLNLSNSSYGDFGGNW